MYEWMKQQLDQHALNVETEFEAQQSRRSDRRFSEVDNIPHTTAPPRRRWLRFGNAAGALTVALVLLVIVGS